VIDSPCLSQLPEGLKKALKEKQLVIFADVCKKGQHPFAAFICELQEEKLLPPLWRCISAPKTYHPLGSKLTFLSKEDIIKAFLACEAARQ